MSADIAPGDAVLYTYAASHGTVYRISGTALAVTSRRVQVRFRHGRAAWIDIIRVQRTKGR